MESMDSRTEGGTARRWTRADFNRMAEAGILGDEENVELIEGEILVMSKEGPLHVAIIGALADELRASFGPSYWIRYGNPFVIDDSSEPQPDLLVVPGSPREWQKRHPEPEDSSLVVEVSDSSLNFDLGRKCRVYARAGVLEYWVIDIPNQRVHVFRDPARGRFRSETRHGTGESLKPLRGAGPAVDLSRVLLPGEPA